MTPNLSLDKNKISFFLSFKEEFLKLTKFTTPFKFESELEVRADNMDIEILSQIKDSLVNAYNQINNN